MVTHDASTSFAGRVIRCATHMSKRSFWLVSVLLAGAQCGLAATAFVGARIISGTGAPAIEDGVLLVDGSRIVAVGSRDKVQIPADAQTIGLEGKFIIPGLISAHSHLGLCQGAAGPQPDHYNRPNVQHQLEQYERYGVTSVLSLGANADVLYTWKDEQKRGQLAGADFFTADRGFGVNSGAPPFPLPDQIYRPADPAEARAEVDQTAAHHPDLMKIWVDDLFGKSPKLSPDIYQAIITEAHQVRDDSHPQGYRVAAHLFYLADAKLLVAAGINILAHSVRDQPVDAELLSSMKAGGVIYVPTLDLDESQFIYAEHPGWMDDPFFTNAVDPQLLQRWLSPLYRKEMEANPNTPKNKAAAAVGQQNLRTIFEAGVTVAMGTDSGALPTRIPGFAEHRELQLMVQSGLSPIQALVCATKNSAQAIGATDRGTLEPGKQADFVVLNADPLTDIAHTTQIAFVVHRGTIVKR
jgi:imidazolonepropionase-like amidohydrolase